MLKNRILLLLCFFLVYSEQVISSSSYHIGNSLTLDMDLLAFDELAAQRGKNHLVGYSIRGSKNLDYIWNNPDDIAFFKVAEYGEALTQYEWDFVTLQPYYGGGSTLGLDQAAITNFIDLTLSGLLTPPVFYIYSAWPWIPDDYQSYWNQAVQNVQNQQTVHARQYFQYLHQNLRDQYPENISIFVIPIGEVFYRLDVEFKAGNVPGFDSAADLYRDEAHLTRDVGSFIVANTVYATFFKEDPTGMPRPAGRYLDEDGLTQLTDELRDFFQTIIWQVVSSHPLSGVDVIPDLFSLGDIVDSPLNTLNYSQQILVSGINTAVDISITSGEYSINNGSYTNVQGVVNNNDTVVVRHSSASTTSSSVNTVLTIGGISDTFTSTTVSVVDSDGDGLSDKDEVATYGTDPLLVDTDMDGYSDGLEVSTGTDPLDSLSTFLDVAGDINNDGLVSVNDLILGMRILLGSYTPSNLELSRFDVAPLTGGAPMPDNAINVGDYLVLQHLVSGRLSF